MKSGQATGEHHVVRVLGQLMGEARELILGHGQRGLRPSQYRVIESVPPDDSITVTELAERVGMTKQGIGQFVTQLTAAGYLTTATDPGDRRVRKVLRTREGNDAMGDLAVMLETLERTWADRLGARRYRQFRNALDDLADGWEGDA